MRKPAPIAVAVAVSAATHGALLFAMTCAVPENEDAFVFRVSVGRERAARPAPSPDAPGERNNDDGGRSDRDAGKLPGRFTSDVVAEETRSIFRNIVYPRVARQKGWQGRVGITVTVGPDGSVQNAVLSLSSGYGVLDEEAMRAVRRHRFPSGTSTETTTFYFRFKLR